MNPDIDTAAAMMGRRVRAVLEGEGRSVRMTGPISRERAPFRVVIDGEVNGWRTTDSGVMVTIAGYGDVPMVTCRRWRWWHR